MTITDTTPLCSVAEADTYLSLDPTHPNRLYVDEWLSATASGTKASVYMPFYLVGIPPADTDYYPYTVTAVDEGDDGNAIRWQLTTGAGHTCTVTGNHILVNYTNVTLAQLAALVAATPAAAALVTVTYTDTSSYYASQGIGYLAGGVDADATRLNYKAPALAMATRAINAMSFKGKKADPDQANAFPRTYTYDSAETSESDVPEAVKMACAEEALAIMKYGNTERLILQKQNVQQVQLGYTGLIEKYGKLRSGLLSTEAMALLRPYMRRAVRIT